VSQLRDGKPEIRPLSKSNTGGIALQAILPVTTCVHMHKNIAITNTALRHRAVINYLQFSYNRNCNRPTHAVERLLHVMAAVTKRNDNDSMSTRM